MCHQVDDGGVLVVDGDDLALGTQHAVGEHQLQLVLRDRDVVSFAVGVDQRAEEVGLERTVGDVAQLADEPGEVLGQHAARIDAGLDPLALEQLAGLGDDVRGQLVGVHRRGVRIAVEGHREVRAFLDQQPVLDGGRWHRPLRVEVAGVERDHAGGDQLLELRRVEAGTGAGLHQQAFQVGRGGRDAQRGQCGGQLGRADLAVARHAAQREQRGRGCLGNARVHMELQFAGIELQGALVHRVAEFLRIQPSVLVAVVRLHDEAELAALDRAADAERGQPVGGELLLRQPVLQAVAAVHLAEQGWQVDAAAGQCLRLEAQHAVGEGQQAIDHRLPNAGFRQAVAGHLVQRCQQLELLRRELGREAGVLDVGIERVDAGEPRVRRQFREEPGCRGRLGVHAHRRAFDGQHAVVQRLDQGVRRHRRGTVAGHGVEEQLHVGIGEGVDVQPQAGGCAVGRRRQPCPQLRRVEGLRSPRVAGGACRSPGVVLGELGGVDDEPPVLDREGHVVERRLQLRPGELVAAAAVVGHHRLQQGVVRRTLEQSQPCQAVDQLVAAHRVGSADDLEHVVHQPELDRHAVQVERDLAVSQVQHAVEHHVAKPVPPQGAVGRFGIEVHGFREFGQCESGRVAVRALQHGVQLRRRHGRFCAAGAVEEDVRHGNHVIPRLPRGEHRIEEQAVDVEDPGVDVRQLLHLPRTVHGPEVTHPVGDDAFLVEGLVGAVLLQAIRGRIQQVRVEGRPGVVVHERRVELQLVAFDMQQAGGEGVLQLLARQSVGGDRRSAALAGRVVVVVEQHREPHLRARRHLRSGTAGTPVEAEVALVERTLKLLPVQRSCLGPCGRVRGDDEVPLGGRDVDVEAEGRHGGFHLRGGVARADGHHPCRQGAGIRQVVGIGPDLAVPDIPVAVLPGGLEVVRTDLERALLPGELVARGIPLRFQLGKEVAHVEEVVDGDFVDERVHVDRRRPCGVFRGDRGPCAGQRIDRHGHPEVAGGREEVVDLQQPVFARVGDEAVDGLALVLLERLPDVVVDGASEAEGFAVDGMEVRVGAAERGLEGVDRGPDVGAVVRLPAFHPLAGVRHDARDQAVEIITIHGLVFRSAGHPLQDRLDGQQHRPCLPWST